MVFEHQAEYGSQWETSNAIAAKIDCTNETLRRWGMQMEIDQGVRGGLTRNERQRMKERERENRKLKQANAIIREA